MFYRKFWFCLILVAIGCVVACAKEETKTDDPIAVSPATALPTATPQQTVTPLPRLKETINPPTKTPVSPTIEPSPSPTSVYNPDTVFSTSLSMSEQCTATDNTYYLKYREIDAAFTIFLSPDNNYKLEYSDDAIWLGLRESTLTQLPISVVDTGQFSRDVHWSPDSRYIILGDKFDRHPLWLVSADGQELNSLSPEEHSVNFAAWSPDSQYLAWMSHESNQDGNYQIVIQSPEANTPPILMNNDPSIRRLTGIGWSSDSLYFAWTAELEDRTEELRIWSVRERRQIYQTKVSQLGFASWAPIGHWLQGRHINDRAHEHILLNADGSDFFRVATPGLISNPPIWSPDGHAFATFYSEPGNQVKIVIMNTDGRVFEDIFMDKDIPYREFSKIWFMTHWLEDDRFLFYVRYKNEDDTFLPILYDSETGTVRPLLSSGNVLEPPTFTADYGEVFLVHQIGSDTWIKTVAIDGSSERILVEDALSAEKLTLFNDDRHLVYAVWRNQGWQIELVNTETGQRQLLQDNLKQVLKISIDEERNKIIIWWIGQDDTRGVSSYFSNGRLFYFSNINPSYRPISAEFWSPNGETAVIKLNVNGRNKNESVVLAYPDDPEWVVVRSGLSGLGDPYWSPDSQMFAFTQLVMPLVSKGIDLEIVDTTGNTLWSYSPFLLDRRYSFGGKNTLEWVACP